MKKLIPWTLMVMGCMLWYVPVSHAAYHDEDDLIEQRFLQLDVPVAPVYDEVAKWYVNRYLTYGRRDASLMLGRARAWFPMIEQVFAAHDIPTSLKYLAIVESHLYPDAESEVGARGMWQFMPSTARLYGLKVSARRDERLDVYRATVAAARFLKDLHREFGDWELALAAYNCGSGRVQQAINQVGTTNYWRLRTYLPRQTARYVPAFLAAAYVWQYHRVHGIEVRPAPSWLRDQAVVMLKGRVSLRAVSEGTGVPLAILRQLNPAWEGGIVYTTTEERAVLLHLPQAAFPAFRAWVKSRSKWDFEVNIQPNAQRDPIASGLLRLHRVRVGERWADVAQAYGVSIQELQRWNFLSADEPVVPGMWLKVYQPIGTWHNA